MAGGKETPRQKMIGMMYLVLTALLALNVSKEILNAFIIMDEGLQKTSVNIEDKNATTMAKFSDSLMENPAKTRKWYDKAEKVREESRKLYNYIENMKAHVIHKADGLPMDQVIGEGPGKFDTIMDPILINAKDNYDVPSQTLGLAEPAVPQPMDHGYDAVTLMDNLTKYKNDLLQLIPDDKKSQSPYSAIENTFALEGGMEHGEPVDWPQMQFYHMPVAAVIANLSKMQVDVRNAESDMLKFLYGQVDAASYKFNKLEPAIIVPKSYLLAGDTFTAKVFLAAFDTTSAPMVTFAPTYADSTAEGVTFGADTLGAENLQIKSGMGVIKVPTQGEGIFALKGRIKIKSPTGGWESYPIETSYQVAKPSFTVSPTKMNVFYKGVDNPVSVSAPGVPADKVKVSISNGSISKSGKDGYIVKVKSGNKAVVSVSAMMDDGSTVKLGPGIEFRVKTVPDPKPYFAGKSVSDDRVKKKELTAAQGVIAKMENFDFDLKFTVISFNMTMMVGGQPLEKTSSSNRVTGDMKIMLQKAKSGSKVYIEKIKARGPDGTVRNLGSLAFKVT